MRRTVSGFFIIGYESLDVQMHWLLYYDTDYSLHKAYLMIIVSFTKWNDIQIAYIYGMTNVRKPP